MELASFIRRYKEDISKEWVEHAKDNIGATNKMDLDAVRDHIVEMLDRIADDMDSSQTRVQQKAKSRGLKAPNAIHDKAAADHGIQRVDAGFQVVELSSEFRALRASVLRLWEKEMSPESSRQNMADMIRFNEAIDEVWLHSVAMFHSRVEDSRNWFLGVLGHDLRNPLTAISASQELLEKSQNIGEQEKQLVRLSRANLKRIQDLLNDLLELTKMRLGSGMGITKESVDLAEQAKQIIREFEAAFPQAGLHLDAPNPVQGHWDKMRINQIFTNLIANALHHGPRQGPVTVRVFANGDTASLSVHNEGNPIPGYVITLIFAGRFTEAQEGQKGLGLGLHIVKEIVDGHQGELHIESSQESGTTVTVSLPRH